MPRLVQLSQSDQSLPVLCDAGDFAVRINDFCVYRDAENQERTGFVCSFAHLCTHQTADRDYPPIIRLAEPRDVRGLHLLRQREREALVLCKGMVAKHKLEMKVSRVDFNDTQHKIVFYFTSDKRVDFRGLVKELAGEFHARIELWQIGVRDETKTMGGLGCCGRSMCCVSWMREFFPVSIRFAKVQDIQFSPAKLSGVCGRLRCCLAYEQKQYVEMGKGAPPVGAMTESEEFGKGKVVDRNLLSETVVVASTEGKYQTFPFERVHRLDTVGEDGKPAKGKGVWRIDPADAMAPSPGPRRGLEDTPARRPSAASKPKASDSSRPRPSGSRSRRDSKPAERKKGDRKKDDQKKDGEKKSEGKRRRRSRSRRKKPRDGAAGEPQRNGQQKKEGAKPAAPQNRPNAEKGADDATKPSRPKRRRRRRKRSSGKKDGEQKGNSGGPSVTFSGPSSEPSGKGPARKPAPKDKPE